MAQSDKSRIAIVGAGLAGALMAIYLGRRGWPVDVFERRGDLRTTPVERGRSINMTIAARGLHALDEVGLLERVMAITMPLERRLVHDASGRQVSQPYGNSPREVHHSLKRAHLNALLLEEAERFSNVRVSFYRRGLRINKESGTLFTVDDRSGVRTGVRAGVIIGADGAYSAVRSEMQRGELADYHQEFLSEGYKELTIPAGPGGQHVLHARSLHVWPRGQSVLIAIPNLDGSFTCTCTMPFSGGPVSFAALRAPQVVRRYFEEQFPDVLAHAPQIADEFVANPAARYLTMRTFPWHYRDRVVLLGDACHSVLPFYGQGMNAAFEDCRILDSCLAQHAPDWESAFLAYESLRKRHTDALADLSQHNYIELKQRVHSSRYVARKRIEMAVNRACPSLYVPLYSLVTHTTMPYADAVAQHRAQARRLRWCGLPIVEIALAAGIRLAAWARARRRETPAPASAAAAAATTVPSSGAPAPDPARASLGR